MTQSTNFFVIKKLFRVVALFIIDDNEQIAFMTHLHGLKLQTTQKLFLEQARFTCQIAGNQLKPLNAFLTITVIENSIFYRVKIMFVCLIR